MNLLDNLSQKLVQKMHVVPSLIAKKILLSILIKNYKEMLVFYFFFASVSNFLPGE